MLCPSSSLDRTPDQRSCVHNHHHIEPQPDSDEIYHRRFQTGGDNLSYHQQLLQTAMITAGSEGG